VIRKVEKLFQSCTGFVINGFTCKLYLPTAYTLTNSADVLGIQQEFYTRNELQNLGKVLLSKPYLSVASANIFTKKLEII